MVTPRKLSRLSRDVDLTEQIQRRRVRLNVQHAFWTISFNASGHMSSTFVRRWDTRHFAILSAVYLGAVTTVVRLPILRGGAGTPLVSLSVAPGVIGQSVTWRSGTVHRLAGVVRVAHGATLTIEPGARVEGAAGAAIVIERTGRIQAAGTLTQPIVLGCPGGVAATRDCWGGVVVAGNAPVNGGTPNSPPARGTGAAGCAQRTDDALVSAYGGCAADDNSGTLRYVRIENGVRGLQLLGVGSGTQVEFVQVFGAGSGGVTLRGGTVDLQHLLVTSSGPVGLRWSGGWVGRGQHVLVQSPAESGVGIEGVNDAAMPSLTPRSSPELYNVSVVRLSDPPGGPATTGIRLADGSGARITNLLVAGFDVSLDIDGATSCALLGTELVIAHAIVGSTAAFGDPDVDAGCANGAATEDLVLATPTIAREANAATIAGFLKAAFVPVLPDFRATSPLFATVATTPPASGFYRQSSYVGAVEIERIGGSNIPWHSGWTRDDLVAPIVALGSVSGVVQSPTRGALNGVRVELGGASALTSATGAYTIDGVLAGTAAIRITTVPVGCTLPVSLTVTVIGGSSAAADITVPCTAITVAPGTLRLTYICGRTFRVRNTNDATLAVNWDVAGTADAGVLSLPARPLTGAFSETFFETTEPGTTRLFYQGNQADVKANGGFVCTP